jgi:hypothetical protein
MIQYKSHHTEVKVKLAVTKKYNSQRISERALLLRTVTYWYVRAVGLLLILGFLLD